MVKAALFIIGDDQITDAEVKFSISYVERTLAESDELSGLRDMYMYMVTSDAGIQSAIAVFPSTEEKTAFDNRDGAINAETNSYNLSAFDGCPVVNAVRAWTQEDAIIGATHIINNLDSVIGCVGFIKALTTQCYGRIDVVFREGGPLGIAQRIISDVQARAANAVAENNAESVSKESQ